MGRWQEKLANMPKAMVTKQTELCFVGSVTSSLSLIEKNNQIVIAFVHQCCVGFNVNPQEVIDGLLDVDDEQEIINGLVPADSLRLHVELWLAKGKPNYSGKKFG